MTLLDALKTGAMHVYEIGCWPDPVYSATVLAKNELEAREHCLKECDFGGPYCVNIDEAYIAYLEAKGEARQ